MQKFNHCVAEIYLKNLIKRNAEMIKNIIKI